MNLARLALPLLALGAPLGAQTVWTVDPSGGGNFTTISAAYAAAAGGDVLLVEPGTYGQFIMNGKGVSVIARVPGTVTVQSAFRIVDTQDVVVVQGIQIGLGQDADGLLPFVVDSPAAPVWVEGVGTFTGNCIQFVLRHDDATSSWPPAMVTLLECVNAPSPTSETVADPFVPSLAGLRQNGGRATVLDCTILGRGGRDSIPVGPGGPPTAHPGGPAVELVTDAPLSAVGELNLSGCTLIGGGGGDGSQYQDPNFPPISCVPAEPGGPAISTTNLPAAWVVRVQDCVLESGPSGVNPATAPCAAPPPPAPPVVVGPSPTFVNGVYRRMSVTATTTPGEYLQEFDGRVAGALCFWTFWPTATPVFVASLDGVVYPSTILPPLFAGTTDATGTLATIVSAGAAAGSDELYTLQSLFIVPHPVTGVPRARLGGPATILLH